MDRPVQWPVFARFFLSLKRFTRSMQDLGFSEGRIAISSSLPRGSTNYSPSFVRCISLKIGTSVESENLGFSLSLIIDFSEVLLRTSIFMFLS